MASFWKRCEGEIAPDSEVLKGKVATKFVRLAEMWRKGSLEKLLESAVPCSFTICTEMQPGKKTDVKGPS